MKHARSDYDDRIQDSAGLIPDDEPVLLIRGQDICARAACLAWISAAARSGVAPELQASVRRHYHRIVAWQAEHGPRIPDAPAEALK